MKVPAYQADIDGDRAIVNCIMQKGLRLLELARRSMPIPQTRDEDRTRDCYVRYRNE